MITRRVFNTAGASALATALAAGGSAANAQSAAAPAPNQNAQAAVPAKPAASPAAAAAAPVAAPAATPPTAPVAAVPAPAVFDIAALGTSQEALASRLIGKLAEAAKSSPPRRGAKPVAAPAPASETISVSPMSAAAALAIVAMGCDRSTQDSIGRALQFPASSGEPVRAFQFILDTLKQLGETGDAAFPLTTANKLVLDARMQPYAAAIAGLKSFGVDVSEENLADPHAIQALNDWVKAKTRNLIPTIIDQPPGAGGLVALNALHFKDRWKSPFDPAKTKAADFHAVDGSVTATQLMHQEGQFLFRQAQKEAVVAVDLPFANDRFGLVVVTRTDKPATATDLLTSAAGWLGGDTFAEAPGELAIPRLELTTSADLLGSLTDLGLKKYAQLSFFGAGKPHITSIAQRTVLKLDEQGAEAAAATDAMGTRSLDDSFVKMVVDKPFLFALRDKTTRLILLAGYVARPEVPKA